MDAVTLDRCPAKAAEVERLNAESWPEFLLHGDVRGWGALTAQLAPYQIVLLTGARVAAAGLTVPCGWSGRGESLPATIDEVVHVASTVSPPSPGVLCALAVLVRPEFRRRGLSRRLLQEMRSLSHRLGLRGVIAPVRPTAKADHPRVPLEEYKRRRRPDGRLADPWLRTHEDLGGTDLGVAACALRVEGTVSDWERWTGRSFPVTGDYDVAGALVPVRIDRERGRGEYVEPNVWYSHEAREICKMGRIEVRQADITALEVDAVVNAANEPMLGGGGVDGAIHAAAGPGLLEECRQVPEVRPGVRCPTGEARVTGGHDLPARFVVHTVGPVWNGGRSGEPERLASCYRESLRLAAERGVRSIAFPAISCGIYGYPLDQAAAVAVATVRAFLSRDDTIRLVVFAAFGTDVHAALESALAAPGPR